MNELFICTKDKKKANKLVVEGYRFINKIGEWYYLENKPDAEKVEGVIYTNNMSMVR